MSLIRIFLLTLMLIYVFNVNNSSYAAKMATEEFGPDKKEMERLFAEGKFKEASKKYDDIIEKEEHKYGDQFIDIEMMNKFMRSSNDFGEGYFEEILEEMIRENGAEQVIKTLENEDFLQQFDEGIADSSGMSIKDVNGSSSYIMIPAYRKMLDIFQKELQLGDSHKAILKVKIRLAESYSNAGESQKAMEMYRDIVPMVKKVFGEKSGENLSLNKILAYEYKILGKYQESKKIYQESLNLCKEIYGENASETFSAIKDVIGIEFKLGNYKDGLHEMEKSFNQKNINQSDAFRYNAIADFYKGKYKEAMNLLNNSNMQIYDYFDDMLVDIMKSAKLRGDYSTSLKNDLMLTSAYESLFGSHNYKTIISMINLSEDYLAIGLYNEALRIAKDAAELGHEKYGGNHPCTLEALTSMTNAYRKLGKYSEANELDQNLLIIKEELFGKNSPEVVVSTEALAYDYDGLGEYSKATKLHEEVWNKYKEFFSEYHPQTLRALKGLALNYLYLKKYEDVIKLYGEIGYLDVDKLKAMESSTESLEMTYILGEAYRLSGKNKEALFYYGKAINGYEKLRNSNVGLTNEEKKLWFASLVPSYKNSASFFITQNENRAAFTTAELCKARTLAEQYSEQLAMYNGDLTNEELNKINDYQNTLSIFKDEIEDAIKHNNKDLRFSFEFAQAKCIQNFNEYKENLQKIHPKYGNILNTTLLNKEVLNPSQIKEILPYNSSFIDFTILKKSKEFSIDSDIILAFVVNKNGAVRGFNIPVDDKFFEQCNLYHDLLAYSNIESMRADNKYLWKLSDSSYKITNGRQSPAQNATVVNSSKDLNNLRQNLSITLGNILLKPLQNYISTNTTWIISPDGELNNIPFETLQFNNKTVIESIDVSYVPSLAVLKLMKGQETKNSSLKNRKGLFAMGDAVYGNSDAATSRGSLIDFSQNIRSTNDKITAVDLTQLKWSNLPGTGKELDQVSTVFNDKEVMRGKNASETNLKTLDKNGNLSEYKYLLFATHGLFVPERPELSSIVLSQGLDKNNDGYVTVGEWMGYNLNSDLVYLSACESGLGEYQAGEGIVGIPYALTIAGNKDTVMSLWKVNDEATAEFSASFFKKLSEGQSEVKALNDTKREFLSSQNAKFNNPSVWAAFLLYGI